jgi:hypothetical protein
MFMAVRTCIASDHFAFGTFCGSGSCTAGAFGEEEHPTRRAIAAARSPVRIVILRFFMVKLLFSIAIGYRLRR